MSSEKQDNIFSLAGKQKAKPKSAPAAPPQTPPVAATPSAAPQPSAVGAALDYDTLKQTFRKVQEMRDELDRSVENVYAQTGWTKDQITRMLDNPSYYQAPGVNAEDLLLRRRTLKKELEKIAGAETIQAQEDAEKAKEIDKRKRKLMGSRRNWLNMR